ncbi:MAG: septum formation initiator family protein [Oscillospiraceae bacterium]|jgi:cell division protein FtsB|nr:septum formation initiator family protein [Oscillospiraceae bacterium]
MFLIKRKRKFSTLIKLLAFIFISYSMFDLVNQHSQIFKKEQELANIENAVTCQKLKNEELKDMLKLAKEKNDKYIEQTARDILGFVKNNERIFVNITGN